METAHGGRQRILLGLSDFQGGFRREAVEAVAGVCSGGFFLGGIGGFWLVNNLTDNAALIAENPGRVVLPALVILLGIVVMFTKREERRTDVE